MSTYFNRLGPYPIHPQKILKNFHFVDKSFFQSISAHLSQILDKKCPKTLVCEHFSDFYCSTLCDITKICKIIKGGIRDVQCQTLPQLFTSREKLNQQNEIIVQLMRIVAASNEKISVIEDHLSVYTSTTNAPEILQPKSYSFLNSK